MEAERATPVDFANDVEEALEDARYNSKRYSQEEVFGPIFADLARLTEVQPNA